MIMDEEELIGQPWTYVEMVYQVEACTRFMSSCLHVCISPSLRLFVSPSLRLSVSPISPSLRLSSDNTNMYMSPLCILLSLIIPTPSPTTK